MEKVNVEKLVPAYLLQIQTVGEALSDGRVPLEFVSDADVKDIVYVDAAFIAKYAPAPGGYYIMCTNGVGMYSE